MGCRGAALLACLASSPGTAVDGRDQGTPPTPCEAAHRTQKTAYPGGDPTRDGATHGTTTDQHRKGASVANDTEGEVIFMGSSMLMHRVFENLPNVNHAYLKLRRQYQNWLRPTLIENSSKTSGWTHVTSQRFALLMSEWVSLTLFSTTSISNHTSGPCESTLRRDGRFEKTVVFPHGSSRNPGTHKDRPSSRKP